MPVRGSRDFWVACVMSEEPAALERLASRIRTCATLAGGGTELARKAAIPRSSLENYLTGSREPKATPLAKIAQAVGVSAHWLLTGDGPMRLSEARESSAPTSQALDVESLTQSIQIVQDWLAENRRTMPAAKQAEVVALIYDLAMQELADGRTTVDMQRAARFLRLVG